MLLASLAILVGFILLVWSADRFVEGAAISARYAKLPSILIGMVIVGFGTSAPEMVVSAMAASDGNPELALGNALGSNIVNIALILGVTALIAPIAVQSSIIKKELPLMLLVVLFSGYLLYDGNITLIDAILLLVAFVLFVLWSVYSGIRSNKSQPIDTLEQDVEQSVSTNSMSLGKAILWLLIVLIFLIISSRILVWGAVTIASSLGVSDLIIGLTIVALGTSLPELASSIIAARKGEHDIAIGNIVGSNIFNILAVIGISGVIEPIHNISASVFNRDWSMMLITSVMLFVMAYGFGKQGRINRIEGSVLLLAYVAYTVYLIWEVVA